MAMRLKVAFSGFWSGFDPQRNLFQRILEDEMKLKIQIVNATEKSDLEFSSTFLFSGVLKRGTSFAVSKLLKSKSPEYTNRSRYGFASRKKSASRRKIWYTGENFRTPYYSADGYLGFDADDPDANIVYFPHWMYRLFEGVNVHSKLSDEHFMYLLESREIIERDLTACMFSSALDPRRLLIRNTLSNYLKVECFGSAFNRRVESKSLTSLRFGIQICPENSIYPGYVTEKLLESWNSGNVPIWEGLDSFGYFNQNAIIDITGLNTSQIRLIFSQLNIHELAYMRSLPILNKLPSLDPVIRLVKLTLEI
jgi:hypothetical protein